MAVKLTRHATARLTQRGIPRRLLDLLIDYGQERHDGHGARAMASDRSARAALCRELGTKAYASWESRLNVYAVLSNDGVLITAGHRLQRIYNKH